MVRKYNNQTRNAGDLRTFALEREVFGKMTAFVVSSKHDYPVWSVDFEGVEVQQTLDVGVGSVKVSMDIREGTHLNSKVSSINIVSQEQIHAILQRTAHFEHLHQVILQDLNSSEASLQAGRWNKTAHILTMDIATNCRSVKQRSKNRSMCGKKATDW